MARNGVKSVDSVDFAPRICRIGGIGVLYFPPDSSLIAIPASCPPDSGTTGGNHGIGGNCAIQAGRPKGAPTSLSATISEAGTSDRLSLDQALLQRVKGIGQPGRAFPAPGRCDCGKKFGKGG